MIETPAPVEAPAPSTKKKTVIIKEAEEIAPEIISDDQGIYDDAQHRFKVDLTQWKLIADEAGVQTYEKAKSNSGLVAFRGETLIPAPLKKIVTVMSQDSLQKEWIDAFVEGKLLSQVSPLERVEYTQTKVPWPFQNRDFVFDALTKLNAKPATALIEMKSILDPLMPPREGIVRGEMIRCFYYFKEIPTTNVTKMVVEMEVDPKGAIPMWLVNLSQKGWPQNTLLALKKLSIRNDIQVLPELEKFFEVKKVVLIKKSKGGNKNEVKN